MADPIHPPILSADLIVHALSRDLDRTVAVHGDGERMTAGMLRDAVSRHQQFLESLDPKPRRAAMLSKNRIEVVEVSTALSFASVVATALHPMGAIEDYLYVIEDAEIDTLVFDADSFEALAAQLKTKAPRIRHFLAMGESAVGTDILMASRTLDARPLVAPRPDPSSLARIAYSGGTTGRPKGIMCSHQGIVTSTLLQLTNWEWPRQVRHLICSPLSHAGASALTPVLLLGGSMVVLPSFDPVSFMTAVEAHRITSVLMVPTMVIALLDHPRFGEFDLSSLEVIFYGASAFPAARLKEAIAKLGPVFFQFYGQAEAPMSVTVMRRDEHDVNDLQRLASCGRPTPLIQVALLDDQGRQVADGEPGEVCVRGPLVMMGYLNKPEETALAFEGDWLHTGDIAVSNPDGFLRIVDRKKDMIITGGFNVFAREVEDVLAGCPGVRQAAVIGVPDPKWGEAVKAIVVLEPGATVSAEDLIGRVRAEKGPVQAPKSVEFVDAIPLSPLGKPDKKALRQTYAA